jgi:hypothetical protein
MSTNKDLRNSLDLIQQLMVDTFIEKLQSGDVTPGEMNTIRQLLKDNHVVVSPDKTADLGTLGALLPDLDEVESDDETTFN